VGVTINSSPETTGVTAFHAEAPVCADTSYDSTSTSFAIGDTRGQDLKEYFRRPRLIDSGFCSNTATILVNRDVNFSNVFSIWFPNGRDRLEGVEGVRFTMVFTVTVAANPFHAGTLVLNYQWLQGFGYRHLAEVFFAIRLYSVTTCEVEPGRRDYGSVVCAVAR
jgi:hypothetical protein